MSAPSLAKVALFAGLPREELTRLEATAPLRKYAPGEALCIAGEPGSSLLVLGSGLAHVVTGEGSTRQIVARLRRGAVLGELSLLGGEPRSATVVAVVATEALEIERETFSALLSTHPQLLRNLVTLLRERLLAANRRATRPERHASALIVGEGQDQAAERVLEAALQARAQPLVQGDRRRGAGIAQLLDAFESTDVLAVLAVDDPALFGVMDYVDRAAFVGPPEALGALRARLGPRGEGLEAAGELGATGRYLARSRLGLALGAGGARGYAHVGALQVLHEAGFVPDAVAGSSIGGVVGACVAMGMEPAQIEAAMRRMFTPETIASLFRLSLGPNSPAQSLWTKLLRELTEDRAFSDLPLPLVVMTADLSSGRPMPLTEGPIWEALLATTALPGLAPPLVRGEARLVDGLALVPVPTDAAREHADVVVSVNLMSRQTLARWPGDDTPPPPKGNSSLDILLEAMDLTHTESSTRHANRADVPLTPRFGPSTWKDFHRADAFLRAGREAALASLDALRALIHPSRSTA